MLKINSTRPGTELVHNFIERYTIWRDYCNFYKQHRDPMVACSQDGIPCFNYSDIKNINANTNSVVAINNLNEGLHSINYFKQYNTTNRYIIFSNGDWDKEYHALPIEYDLVPSLFYLLEIADTYNSPNRFCYYGSKVYDFDSPKEYSFVSTVGNVRPERDYIVNRLAKLHPNRKFVLRYSGQDLGMPSNHLDVIKITPGEFDPYTDILAKYYHNVSQSLPIDMYNAARFNLVVETDLDYQHCFFLTEKTCKVLMSGTPFVSMSHPNFLTRIRQLGFQTYHTLWDESYDQETDYYTRAEKVANLCDKLCDFDWAAHRPQLEAIKFHNLTNFLNLNHVCEQEFQNFEAVLEKYIT